MYSGPQPNTTHSPSNHFSTHSFLTPTSQQSHRPPPTADQPVYPPLLQSTHPYTNTGPAHNITGMSAYPSDTSYPQLPYYPPTASGSQPNTTHSPSNPFSTHSLLRPTRTLQRSHHLSPLLRPTPQQPHHPPPTPHQPVYPPLLQPTHPYTNTGPAHNITGMSAYPSNTSYPQLSYYRPTASSPFSASQPTHSTPPWLMTQYPHMGMNTNLYTTAVPHPPYPPPFQHTSSYPEYYPQVPTDSLPTGSGPLGQLPGLPVNTSGQYCMVFTCCQVSHFIRVLMLMVK